MIATTCNCFYNWSIMSIQNWLTGQVYPRNYTTRTIIMKLSCVHPYHFTISFTVK